MDAKEDPINRLTRLTLTEIEKMEPILQIGAVNYKWDDNWFSKLPTSTLPKTVKNAGIINTILVKSWETEGSK